jgi:large subunit ribosomal protein L35
VPKLKTHKGAAARFKITKNGKLLRNKGRQGHFRRRKAKRVKRDMLHPQPGSPADAPKIKRLLPYGSIK